jgi:hypothetical protein
MFFDSKYLRTAGRNAHYVILTASHRNKSVINTIAKQAYPGNAKFVMSAYDDALSADPYGFLFLVLFYFPIQSFRFDRTFSNRIFIQKPQTRFEFEAVLFCPKMEQLSITRDECIVCS